MKGKPIEPGCIAMIVGAVTHPKNNGKIVKVLRLKTEDAYTPPEIAHLLRNHRHTSKDKTWIVETTGKNLQFTVNRHYRTGKVEALEFFVSSRAVAEIRLKRLDDGEDCTDETTTEHQLENTL